MELQAVLWIGWHILHFLGELEQPVQPQQTVRAIEGHQRGHAYY
jgi:hypothetical protein